MVTGVTLAIEVKKTDVHLSYLPLAHIAEKGNFINVMFAGGKLGIFCGDLKKIKEDLGLLRPTLFIAVPRIYNKFYNVIKGKLNQ